MTTMSPFEEETFAEGSDYIKVLNQKIGSWAQESGLSDEIRFKGKPA